MVATRRNGSGIAQFESEERFRRLVEISPDAITVTDLNSTIRMCNHQVAELHGYESPDELIGCDAFVLIAPEDHQRARDNAGKTLETGSIRNIEYTLLRKDGSRFPAELSASVVLGPDQEPMAFIGVVRDITARRRVEEELRQARDDLEKQVRQRSRELERGIDMLQVEILQKELALEALQLPQFALDHSGDAVFWVAPDARHLYANHSASRLLGYTREELLRMTVQDVDPGSTRSSWAVHWQELKEIGSLTFEEDLRRKDGSIVPTEITANYVTFDGHEYNCAFIRDISERKLAEVALREAHDKLQARAGQVIEAQEAERKRVARDLHDGVNQLLSSARFRLLATVRGEGRSKAGHAAMARAAELVEQAMQEVRRISQDLLPPELEELGFIAATEGLCEEFRARSGVTIDLQCRDVTCRLSAEAELQLYRVVQEALNNIARHAGPCRVGVTVALEQDALHLAVCDDGKGFRYPPARGTGKRGLGLGSIRERVDLLGGDLTICSAPGKGTEIALRVPLANLLLHAVAASQSHEQH